MSTDRNASVAGIPRSSDPPAETERNDCGALLLQQASQSACLMSRKPFHEKLRPPSVTDPREERDKTRGGVGGRSAPKNTAASFVRLRAASFVRLRPLSLYPQRRRSRSLEAAVRAFSPPRPATPGISGCPVGGGDRFFTVCRGSSACRSLRDRGSGVFGRVRWTGDVAGVEGIHKLDHDAERRFSGRARGALLDDD